MNRMRLKPTSDPANHEKLERLKRWPSIRRRWEGSLVRIWSEEHYAYWRPGFSGYTTDGLYAGVYKFEEAFEHTRGSGPEKCIEFKLVIPVRDCCLETVKQRTILLNAHREMRFKFRHRPLFAFIKVMCGVGSTTASAIAKECGWNPDQDGWTELE